MRIEWREDGVEEVFQRGDVRTSTELPHSTGEVEVLIDLAVVDCVLTRLSYNTRKRGRERGRGVTEQQLP